MADRVITDRTRKLLWWSSGQHCAFPGCEAPLVDVDAPSGASTIVGKECHIVAQRDTPTVARAPCTLSEDETVRYAHLIEHRHAAENLILLCGRHSDIIDDRRQGYSVPDVLAMKRRHVMAQRSSMASLDLLMVVSEAETLICQRTPIAPCALRFPIKSNDATSMVDADDASRLEDIADELGSLGCILGEPGAGKSMFLYALVRHFGLQAIEGKGQLHPMLIRTSALPVGTSVLQMVQARRARLGDASEIMLVVDDLDQIDHAERIVAESITISQAQLARVVLACVPNSALLRHGTVSSASQISIRSLTPAEAEELASALVATSKSGSKASDETLKLVRAALPRRPLYIELACAGVKREPEHSQGRSAASILRATLYAATLPPRPGTPDPSTAALLSKVGEATWVSAAVSDAGFRRLPELLDDPELAAQVPRMRALLRPDSLGEFRWRHPGLTLLAVAWWLSGLRAGEITELCCSQSIANPRVAVALQLGLAWSASRDEALSCYLSATDNKEFSDVVLHQSDFCRGLAMWTTPDEWSPASRSAISEILVDLCRIEGAHVVGQVAHWSSATPFLEGLKKAMRKRVGTGIAAAAADTAAFATLHETALARLRKSLRASANAEVPLALHAAGDEADRERAEEHFLARALDNEEHPNARAHAVRRLGDYSATRSSAVARLMAVVAGDVPDGIRVWAAAALFEAGDQHLETMIEETQDDCAKAIGAAVLVLKGDERQSRLGWDVVRRLMASTQDTYTADLCGGLLERKRAQQQGPQPPRRGARIAHSLPPASAFAMVRAIRSSRDLHDARDLVNKLVASKSLSLRTRQHALRIVALDESVDDWARVGAARGLVVLNGDLEAAERGLNEVILDAHPITAASAMTVLRGMGANEDNAVARFAEIGEGFFFSGVAAGVLSSTQGLKAFEALAAILKRHKRFDLLPHLRDSMALLFPVASKTEWDYALRRAARVTATVMRHAPRG